MNKLFGLFLLALAFLPGGAEAASRFLTCNTTCTITAADTSIWGTTTGGTGASVPTTTDDVILDANTCVGGTTCTATFGSGYNPTWNSITMTACTASTSGCILDANTNGNTITLTGVNPMANGGSGTRTISGGTWVLSSNTANWNSAASSTVSNAPNISFTGTGGTTARRFTGGGKTYGTVSFSGNSNSLVQFNDSNTFGTLTISAPNRFELATSITLTVTNLTTVSGSSSNQVLFMTNNGLNGISTISSANDWTCDWCGFFGMTMSGGGTFSATNGFNGGNNTGITITAPSGGGGGGKIIGG